MRMHLLFPLFFAAAFLAACATTGSKASATAESQMKEADRALDRACRDHDAQAFGTLVCSDAIFGGKTFAVGRAEVLQRWAPLIAGQGTSLTWAPEKAGASPTGDLGWTVGDFRFQAGDGPVEEGQYVTVWRREGGRYCVSMDTNLPKADALSNVARQEPQKTERSEDLVAETGWLEGEAGTWLEIRRCPSPDACRVEVLSVVEAPRKEP
ncbi:MAG: nuclear transport factor 2 family protein [Myxococcales bacterium]